MKVAIQGLLGSFHHEAAEKLLSGQEFEIVECDFFPQVFAAVENGEADLGVCAIENSLHGSINPVYRLLERYSLWVSGEITLHISQYLLGHKSADVAALNKPETVILSQAPSLAQTELWLDEHLPLAVRQEYYDNAASVREVVRRRDAHSLAIAGRQAAELYGATVLAGPINDDPNNFTRFVMLQKERGDVTGANRTSITIKTDHSPGALYRVLGILNDLDINLSKLDSHPLPTDKRHYLFYIDFEAGLGEPRVTEALAALVKMGCGVKVLGSYKTA